MVLFSGKRYYLVEKSIGYFIIQLLLCIVLKYETTRFINSASYY